MVVDHAPRLTAVPEPGGVAAHHVEADHLDAAVALQPHAVDLAHVAERIFRGAVVGAEKVVVARVSDEHFVWTTADAGDDAGVGCGSSKEAVDPVREPDV